MPIPTHGTVTAFENSVLGPQFLGCPSQEHVGWGKRAPESKFTWVVLAPESQGRGST